MESCEFGVVLISANFTRCRKRVVRNITCAELTPIAKRVMNLEDKLATFSKNFENACSLQKSYVDAQTQRVEEDFSGKLAKEISKWDQQILSDAKKT